MAQVQHTAAPPSLEEALTVLFCLIDDTYRRLNPHAQRYETLKKLSGLDPGRRTHQSFGCECRLRRSTMCREQHQATRQSSNEKPSALSAPRQTGAS